MEAILIYLVVLTALLSILVSLAIKSVRHTVSQEKAEEENLMN